MLSFQNTDKKSFADASTSVQLPYLRYQEDYDKLITLVGTESVWIQGMPSPPPNERRLTSIQDPPPPPPPHDTICPLISGYDGPFLNKVYYTSNKANKVTMFSYGIEDGMNTVFDACQTRGSSTPGLGTLQAFFSVRFGYNNKPIGEISEEYMCLFNDQITMTDLSDHPYNVDNCLYIRKPSNDRRLEDSTPASPPPNSPSSCTLLSNGQLVMEDCNKLHYYVSVEDWSPPPPYPPLIPPLAPTFDIVSVNTTNLAFSE